MENIFKVFKNGLVCILLISLIALTWTVKKSVDKSTVVIQNLPIDLYHLSNNLTGTIHEELQETRDFTGEQISALTKTADKRLQAIQNDTRVLGYTALNLSSQSLDKFNQTLNNQLTDTNKSIAQLTNAYATLPEIVGKRLDPYTDCDKNVLCWQGQISDTLFAVRTTSRDVSKTMTVFSKTNDMFNNEFPKITKNTEEITANINSISANIKRITTPHWYDKIFGYALNGAILYRELNPVTQITSTVTSAISSQK